MQTIKKKKETAIPSSLTEKNNAFISSAFISAAIEALKQLIIELSYIIPTLSEIGSDITLTETVSMLISVLFCLFVFAIGYLIILAITIKLEANKKIQ